MGSRVLWNSGENSFRSWARTFHTLQVYTASMWRPLAFSRRGLCMGSSRLMVLWTSFFLSTLCKSERRSKIKQLKSRLPAPVTRDGVIPYHSSLGAMTDYSGHLKLNREGSSSVLEQERDGEVLLQGLDHYSRLKTLFGRKYKHADRLVLIFSSIVCYRNPGSWKGQADRLRHACVSAPWQLGGKFSLQLRCNSLEAAHGNIHAGEVFPNQGVIICKPCKGVK